MEIILLERIEKLGQMGEVVKVKDGYARNFLLPQKKALRATDENRSMFETQRVQLEAHNLERRGEAETVASKLDGTRYVVLRQASDTGQLYGSVTIRDIADAVVDAGFRVEKRQVSLTSPIKTLGIHDVRINLHPEVSASVSVNVARSEEEAEAQNAAPTEGTAPETAGFFETEEAALEAEETLAESEQENVSEKPATAPEETDTNESPDEEGAA
jgi:large subunit ribosomal protein L9